MLHTLIHATHHLVPDQDLMAGYINGWLYEPTAERIGIVPLPSRLCDAADMEPFDSHFTGEMSHRFLAQNQGTRFAIMPVATDREKQLYAELRRNLPSMKNNNYIAVAKIWNQRYANGKDCFYKVHYHCRIDAKTYTCSKLAEHLASHFRAWQRNANIRTTLLSTEEDCSIIQDQITKHLFTHHGDVPQYNQAPIPIPTCAPLHSLPTSGPSQPGRALQRNTLDQFLSINAQSVFQITGQQEPTTSRKRRTCRRCGNNNDICKGAMKVKDCRNACQDCGDFDCAGRAPKNFQNNRTCDRTGNKIVRS